MREGSSGFGDCGLGKRNGFVVGVNVIFGSSRQWVLVFWFGGGFVSVWVLRGKRNGHVGEMLIELCKTLVGEWGSRVSSKYVIVGLELG